MKSKRIIWCSICGKFTSMKKSHSIGEIGSGEVVCFRCYKKIYGNNNARK